MRVTVEGDLGGEGPREEWGEERCHLRLIRRGPAGFPAASAAGPANQHAGTALHLHKPAHLPVKPASSSA